MPNRYHQRPDYIRRRRVFISIIIFVTLAIIGSVLFFISHATTPMTVAKATNIKPLVQPEVKPIWPNYGSGAIGTVSSEDVLAQYGDKSPRPIASITKIITALLVLQVKPLSGTEEGPTITLTQADFDMYNRAIAAGAAVKPVVIGSSMTEREMLETMLLPSAANYSETLAVWAYGSVGAYLSAANSWLVKNSLSETKVVDTSGLLPTNTSVPSDLIKLGKFAIKNSSLASIVSLKKAIIPDVGEISNSNQLLGQLGINGIKTGTTSEAGACMLFSSIITVGDEKVTVIGVLLGADDRGQQNTDIINLLKSIQPGFRLVKVISRDQKFAVYDTVWGQTSNLVSSRDVSTVVWSNTPISYKVKADNISTVKSGEEKGVVMVSIGGKVIKQSLLTSDLITNPSVWWRLSHLNY